MWSLLPYYGQCSWSALNSHARPLKPSLAGHTSKTGKEVWPARLITFPAIFKIEIMATSGKTDGAVFTGVEWSSPLVSFHKNKGSHVRLTEGNKVATRVDSYCFGTIVFTAEPLSVGQLFKVTLAKRVSKWSGGLVSVWYISSVYIAPQILLSMVALHHHFTLSIL